MAQNIDELKTQYKERIRSRGDDQKSIRLQIESIQSEILYEEEKIRTHYKNLIVLEDAAFLQVALQPIAEKRQALALALAEFTPMAAPTLSIDKEISQKLVGRPYGVKIFRRLAYLFFVFLFVGIGTSMLTLWLAGVCKWMFGLERVGNALIIFAIALPILAPLLGVFLGYRDIRR